MIVFYNILQILSLPLLFFPLLLLTVLVPKYRLRVLHRLGFGLERCTTSHWKKTIWIHALSVGESTSALPLVSALREEMPNARLIFSTSSRAGAEVAEKTLTGIVDQFVAFPFDILPVIIRFLRVIRPDFFILVETDFWPNILASLKRQNIPSMLVNGRISDKSFKSYQRFSFFFRPLFSSFHTLSMQTEKDRQNLITLGVPKDQILTLGNLKYDTSLYCASERNQPLSFSLPTYEHLFVAGSTHAGEEKIILRSYRELKKEHPGLYLVIAPRNIEQGQEIHALAATMDLAGNRRSLINAGGKDLLILDTIGELNSVYSHGDFAFVGGSLVPRGGHNPIEPASFSIPVLYGPHMDDFSEISEELIRAGGAITVRDGAELTERLRAFLADDQLRKESGRKSAACIKGQQGVIKRHIRVIKDLL